MGRSIDIRVKESPYGNMVADLIFTAYPEADCFFMGCGDIRKKELSAGHLTTTNFKQIMPDPNTIHLLEVQG